MKENHNNLTLEDVLNGLESLIRKVSNLALCAHILDRYFDGFKVTHATMSMSIVIDEFVRHISGQLSRIYRDKNSKYKTASIVSIYCALKKTEIRRELRGTRHQKIFNEIKGDLRGKRNHLDKIQFRCDKYYAHSEIRSVEEAKRDFKETKITWEEIVSLINTAKEILNKMSLYAIDTDQEFAEGYYDSYQNQFWGLVDPVVFSGKSK